MSSKEKENKSNEEKTSAVESDGSSGQAKPNFGSLTPLTAAQIVTLLIGTGMSNTSSGGGY